MHVSEVPEIPSTREELGNYLDRRVNPADVNLQPSFSLKVPYSVMKSEPCAITGMSSAASTCRVAVLKARSDQNLLIKYIHSLRSTGSRFRLCHPSNVIVVKSDLQKHLVGEFPTLILTLSDVILNKLIRLVSSDNKYRKLNWEDKGRRLDPYREITVLSQDFNDSMFQLVLLDPERFSGESLTVRNPITNTKGVYVAGSDGYLRESPGGTDCPIIPPMPFYEGRPRAPHRTNPFYVALSSASIFAHYESNPTRLDGIPKKARDLLSKTLKIKKLLEWKLRTDQGTVPRRYPNVGSMADLSLWTTSGNQANDANPIDFCLAEIPDEDLMEFLNTASAAYEKTEQEEDPNDETDDGDNSDTDEHSYTLSSPRMRVGEDSKGTRLEADDNSGGHSMVQDKENENRAEDHQARLDALCKVFRDDPEFGKEYDPKEITNLQYAVE